MSDSSNSSYPETADIETSSDGYAQRFAGPAGEWMLSVQEKIVLGWLAKDSEATVLDVGGGHAQLAIPMSKHGLRVTVLGSSEECADRIRKEVDAGKIDFKVGNLIDIPCERASFDTVVSIRLLPHCDNWQKLIEEMCRVAGKTVIVDYPTGRSLNCLSGALFGAKKKMEGNTRPFTLFSRSEIEKAFGKHGFVLSERRPQFFLPMVVHRMLKCPCVSGLMEGVSRCLGLTWLLGSPVLARFVRDDDS
jgi:2-polyprenyl-3-methyl-5-hydroxy-6-metoxy-1,4-benzoquinol methylase